MIKVYCDRKLINPSDSLNKEPIKLVHPLKMDFFKDLPFTEEVAQVIPEGWHYRIKEIHCDSRCIIHGLIYDIIVIRWEGSGSLKYSDSIFAGYFNSGAL